MKRLVVFCALLGLVVLTQTAGQLKLRSSSSGQSATDALLDSDSRSGSRHPFTDNEYLQRRRFEPKGAVAICCISGDSSFYSHFVALSDSIFNGTGAWANSLAVLGQRVRGTVFVAADSVGLGRKIRKAQLVTLGGRSSDFEIGCTTGDNRPMGWDGVTSTGAGVSAGGQTHMKAQYISAVADLSQDSLVAWGIPAARSWAWGKYKYQAAIGPLMQDQGYFQALGLALSVQDQQTKRGSGLKDTLGCEGARHVTFQTFAQPTTYATRAASAWAKNANERWGGSHEIGEPVDPFNIGARRWYAFGFAANAGDSVSGNDRCNTPDSLTSWIDLNAHMSSIGIVSFAGRMSDSTASAIGYNDCKYDSLRKVVAHIAHRQAEGVLESLTFEQATARIRGIRTGSLLKHYQFKRMGNDAIGGSGAPSKLTWAGPVAPFGTPVQNVPMGWGASNEQYAAPDTFVAPGATGCGGAVGGCEPHILCLATRDTVTVAAAARGDTLSHGVANSLGNVIIQEGFETGRTRPLTMTICTTGCDKRYVMIQGQVAFVQNGTFSADSLFACIKAAQYSEHWDDNFMQGPSAYNLMTRLEGGLDARTDTTGLAMQLIDKERLTPLWTSRLVASDSSAAGSWRSMYNADDQAPISWMHRAMMQSVYRLLPTMVLKPQSGNWDFTSTIGSARSPILAGGSPDDRYVDNVEPISDWARPYNFFFYVPIDQVTDYVHASINFETFSASSPTTAVTLVWLGLEAYAI